MVIPSDMSEILIVDCGSSKVPAIEKALETEAQAFKTVKLTELVSVDGYQGIIISGAPILLTETAHTPYLEKAAIIFKHTHIPILGICFGHQLMGIYHGAQVNRCKEDRDFQNIVFPQPHPFISGTPGLVSFHEDHCECIGLPQGFQRLASSVICTNEAMMHDIYPWFGVQFHPETSGEQGHAMIANFIRYCREF